ncbi:MAG: M48 family metalloprotease [Candidatus Omnitrophota bacterium]
MKITKFLLVLVFLTGCITVYNPATDRKEHYFFSEETEVSWGKAVADRFVQTNEMSKGQQAISYLERVGAKVAQQSHRNNLQYHFYLIDKNEINAFAVFGGHIFVYQGLLDKVSEDELAFVLGHELGHICARHSLKRLQASLGFAILTGILLRSPDLASAQSLSSEVFNMVSLGYSRKDELQADSLGLQYTIKAGYDSAAVISLFEMLQKESKGAASIPFYLRSHPYPEQRIENIKKEIEKI